MSSSLCGANCAECPTKESCYGVIAREGFLLVCSYGEVIAEPELVVYKRR